MKDNYTYNRSWEQIIGMLEKAEKKQNWHWMMIQRKDTPKNERMMHMRNYKGLEGVINALRWTVGDRKMTTDIVLGDKK
jgi:hypothetical protein